MSEADRKLAREIVSPYRPAPTATTVKALSGQRAAMTLVAQNR